MVGLDKVWFKECIESIVNYLIYISNDYGNLIILYIVLLMLLN